MNEEKSKSGEPSLPVDEYDKAHGEPCEQDYRANPTNQPEIGPRSFNVKG